MRVLVVEDHPALARQVMDALAEAGFVADHVGTFLCKTRLTLRQT